MREPAEHFKRCLSDAGCPLWFPGLADTLVANTPQENSADYSTSRFVARAEPQMTFIVEASAMNEGPNLRIEVLPEAVGIAFASRGLDLVSSEEADRPEVRQLLNGASELIGASPSLASSVQLLTKSIHLLRQEDPSIDVSFSDPSIPFSIFVSVCPGAELAPYRLAEAIVHESMHLQLTLIEKTTALLREEKLTFYSPWKRSQRPASGMLHAVYVFGVIEQWLKLIAQIGIGEHYAQRRRAEIASEVAHVDETSIKCELSHEGKLLLERLTRQR